MKSAKTNAVRLLEGAGIEFRTFIYDSSEEELDAVSVADKINAEHEQVFKTLVARGISGDIFVFCIPGNYELDLKKAASVSGNKKIEMIKVKELLPLTGYIRGGCSPVGMKKDYPTFIDETAQMFDQIYVSAGIRGMQIKINPIELLNITEAIFCDLIS